MNRIETNKQITEMEGLANSILKIAANLRKDLQLAGGITKPPASRRGLSGTEVSNLKTRRRASFKREAC